MKKGYVQVYTGDGKGKTTAAIGLSVRAIGAGFRVLFAQFLKKGEFSEIKALAIFGDRIRILQFGSGRFVRGRPQRSDFERARHGLQEIRKEMSSGRFDLVVLDEANVAMKLGLIPVEDMLELIRSKPKGTELVLTGRGAPGQILQVADLVSECRVVKHYLGAGVKARTGIEK
ncbi:MAG: cob(I)yrinic acid a,c-diamide adenosyltransferase [Thermodesulfatator sp.]|nr:MAG: cob(I)yrinic acid a,c-diamide adenosyltransferase [Thermodesulfatator sp.]